MVQARFWDLLCICVYCCFKVVCYFLLEDTPIECESIDVNPQTINGKCGLDSRNLKVMCVILCLQVGLVECSTHC